MTTTDPSPAVGLNEFGGPEVLQLVELPYKAPGPGEVRVRSHAATVNPTDTLFRAGVQRARLEEAPPPYVPGMDFAGVIEEVGEGVSWQIGDDVAGIALPGPDPSRGGYANRIVVPAASLTRIPRGRSYVEASTLPMNGLTTVRALDLLDLPAGSVLGVTGAAGAVGGYAVQLAKLRGLRVIADASQADAELVGYLGADAVIERGAGVAERFIEAAGESLDGILDAAVIGRDLLRALKDNGSFAAIRGVDWKSERGIAVHRIVVRDYATTAQDKLDQLRQYVEDGSLTLRVARSFAPAAAADAHRQLEAGGTRGRLVIDWDQA